MAEKLKRAWHLNLFSRTRVNTRVNLQQYLMQYFRKMSSWDTYANHWINTDEDLCQVGIFDKNGYIWGKAIKDEKKFEPHPNEIKFLISKCTEEKTDEEKFVLAGVEYMFIDRTEFDGLVLMSKGLDETQMCVLGLSNNACVICTMVGPSKNKCIVVVEKILENIKQSGN